MHLAIALALGQWSNDNGCTILYITLQKGKIQNLPPILGTFAQLAVEDAK